MKTTEINKVTSSDKARGGKRSRAGRKPIPEEDRRVQTSLLLSKVARDNLEKLCQREDKSFGETMDKLLTSGKVRLYLLGNGKDYI
jgi:hypothetical protein